MNRTKKFIIWNICIVLVILGITEYYLRQQGYTPWAPYRPNIIRVEPDNRFFTVNDVLGYVNIPGKLKVVMNSGYSWTATHLSNYQRITRPLESYKNQSVLPEIWIFGDSEAYGWSVNDEYSYPWILQELLPMYEVVNFGTAGYSTLQSLLQLQETLKNKPAPAAAIITYSSFHAYRNVFAHSIRKAVAPWNKLGPMQLPYGSETAKKNLKINSAPAIYEPLPGSETFAFMNFLDDLRVRKKDSKLKPDRITYLILKEISSLAKNYGFAAILIGLDDDRRTYNMLELARGEGFLVYGIYMNLLAPENMNLPHDLHRNPSANRKIAEQVASYLQNNLFTN